jgi:L-aminopeptidase/D-esterase-like protein
MRVEGLSAGGRGVDREVFLVSGGKGLKTLGAGFKVGHYTNAGAMTGCTVVIPPPGNVTSCDIRGSSPGSRELVLLDPDRRLSEVSAILLTGGSAFGLAAATGVVEWLEERGVGYETPVARVPIVPAAVVFDLRSGDPSVRPGPAEGRTACDNAEDEIPRGLVGAGTGATVGKWAGPEHGVPGGLGVGEASEAGVSVRALTVVNAVGDVLNDDATVLAGSRSPDAGFAPPDLGPGEGNTVLTVVTVRATLGKHQVRWLAARGTDGVTRSVRPAHTLFDGDVTFGVAVPPAPGAEPDLTLLGHLATQAVAAAVRDAVTAR